MGRLSKVAVNQSCSRISCSLSCLPVSIDIGNWIASLVQPIEKLGRKVREDERRSSTEERVHRLERHVPQRIHARLGARVDHRKFAGHLEKQGRQRGCRDARNGPDSRPTGG